MIFKEKIDTEKILELEFEGWIREGSFVYTRSGNEA